MGRNKKKDTINLQNFETDLDISINSKFFAGKKSEVEVSYPYTLSEKKSPYLLDLVPEDGTC